MPDITEGDLLTAIMADYVAMQRQPGDVTINDILEAMREVNPIVTEEQAAYAFRQAAKRKGVVVVRILENGKVRNALRSVNKAD